MLNDVLTALDALAKNSFKGIRYNYPVGSILRDFTTDLDVKPTEGDNSGSITVEFNILHGGAELVTLCRDDIREAMLFAANADDRMSAALNEWANQHNPDGSPQQEHADSDRPYTGPITLTR